MKNKTIKELAGLVNDPEYKDEAFKEIEQRISDILKAYANKYTIKGYEPDDLYNEFLLEIYSKIHSWDKKIDFTICVRVWCRNILSDLNLYQNVKKRKSKNISLDYNNYDDEEGNLYNLLPVFDHFEEQEESAYLINLLKLKLSSFEDDVFSLMLESYVTSQIAELLDVDYKVVDNAQTRILTKARAIYKEYLDNNL